MIIIGCDPGNVSGMAWWDLRKDAPSQWREEPYETFGDTFREWMSWCANLDKRNVHVGCEKYVMTPGIKTAQPAALMTMGIVEDQTKLYGTGLHWYLSATTKKKSNTLLRKLGWWTPTKDGHVNDALRVVLCELSRVDPKRYADLVGL
jgi:hypothetical protein